MNKCREQLRSRSLHTYYTANEQSEQVNNVHAVRARARYSATVKVEQFIYQKEQLAHLPRSNLY